MRSIEEFKQDRAQWNRQAEKRHQIGKVINWIVALILLAALAIGGWKGYQVWKTNQANQPDKAKSADVQPSGN